MASMKDWSDCQIKHIPTDILVSLRDAFSAELGLRRQQERLSSIRQLNSKTKIDKQIDRGLLELVNGSSMLSVPYPGALSMRMPYLRALVNQDWSSLFTADLDPTPKYYVYAHVAPDGPRLTMPPDFGGNWGGQPFYIGKGCGTRAHDLKRNQAHGQHIANAIKAGFFSCDIVKIIKDGLTEAQALELEAKYIYLIGTAYDEKQGPLVNLDRSMVPEFTGAMTKYAKVKRENRHWISTWKRDHADILGSEKTTSNIVSDVPAEII